MCHLESAFREDQGRGKKRGSTSREKKRGSGMKDHVDKSLGISYLITETLTKIQPTEG